MVDLVNVLHVDLNGHRVGDLIRSNADDLTFAYDDEWLHSPLCRPLSLSLPLQQKVHSGSRMLHFFENLLPDNPAVITRIVREFNIRSSSAFDVLSAIGRDCVGALQFYSQESEASLSKGGYRVLTTSEVETLLSNLQLKPLGMDSEEDFRISIAGAQEKTALTKTADGGWALPLGASATSHIFKTPIGSLQANTIDFSESCENEWLCLEIARNFGLPAAKTEVLRFGKQKAIVVERFDRKKSKEPKKDLLRLPTEDFCQALGVSPAQKYEADGGPGILDIMAVLKWSDDAAADQRRFMAAQVLLWLLDSTDGHAKNYSIFLEARNCYRLTPLYDVMSVAPLTATGALSPRRVKLAMGLVGRNRHYRTADIEPRHFLSTAEAAGFSRTEMTAILRDFCVKTPSVVKNIRASLPANFPKSTSEPILSILEKRAARIARFLG